MAKQATFTGRSRERRTKWSVRLVDRFASTLITVGGIGTIVAVSAVCVYLVWMTLPLFGPASLAPPRPIPTSPFDSAPVLLRIADSDQIGWALSADGRLTSFRPTTGDRFGQQELGRVGPKLTAFAGGLGEDALAVGDDRGSVRLGVVRFSSSFIDAGSDEANEFRGLKPGKAAADSGGVVSRSRQGQLVRESVVAEFGGEPIEISPGNAILRLDRVDADAGPVLLAWSDDGKARLATVERTEDLFTGESAFAPGTITDLPINGAPSGPPLSVVLGPRASESILVWPDGTALRFDTRDRANPRLLERADFTGDSRAITRVASMVGRLTLLVGDDRGNVSAWFPARREVGTAVREEEDSDATRLVRGHDFGDGPAAVAEIAPSSRSRVAAVGYVDGTVRLYDVTTESKLCEARLPEGVEATGSMSLFLPPAEGATALYAASGGALCRAALDAGYPEAGFRAFFRPVWYESYPGPRHVWQTSSGTNASEPKLGMVPLVFGTLKATFYSMLFGVPLALLAALYTSEFLSSRMRSRVKPVIEIMASLPSVVLGFIAAIVFAPVVEAWLPSVIAGGLTVPLTLLAAAHVWQLAPVSGIARWDRLRLPFAGLALLGGFGLAAVLGPLLERFLFAGNVKLWLNGQIGSGAGAWILLLLPVCGVAVALAMGRWLNPLITEASARWTRRRFVTIDLGRFVGAVAATLAVAAILSSLLGGLDGLLPIDLDPRGSYVGTYVQRNALVVGFVMGFAIIPIIYTLADDALHAVPEALRSASLGAGATPWQTALRVVIPTAMSGLFSAVMVGLGRAVGETMIVLMAAGNTPIMELNIFNGFQTLSAAIATEMPEAVRGSTHFRTLFLAALVLFGLTFIVNTVAELVRLRFRRRMVQL